MSSLTPERGATAEKSSEPWRWLALLVAIALLAFARSGPPAPEPLDAPASEFSAARAELVLARILGPSPAEPQPRSSAEPQPPSPAEPHPVGTPEHERVRERLALELAHLGLAVEVQEALVTGPHSNMALVRNVLARVRGRDPAPAVMLTAHYDSVAAGPGAGDDGAGVAALLEIARIVSSGPTLGRDVIFLFTDGEELGLLGARAFCAEHAWAKDVGIVVNLEGRGTCGPSEMFETSEDNADLIALFGRVVRHPAAVSLAYEVYKRMPNDTDMTVFKRAGMAGFNFAFIGGSRRYHTPLDDLAHLDLGSLQHHGDNALALVRAEADRPLAAQDSVRPHSAARALYADILGCWFWSWPESFALPIAIIELLACAWCAYVLSRSRSCTPGAIGRGMIVCLALLCAAAVFGWALSRACAALGRSPEPWAGRLPLMAVCIASGTLCTSALLLSLASVRRVGILGAWVGASAVFLVIGVVVATWLPSASYLCSIPGAMVAFIAVLATPRPHRFAAWLAHGLALLPLGALALVWMPLAIGLERAIEYHVSTASALLIDVLLASAAPTWLAAPRPSLRRIGIVAGACAIVSCAVLVSSAAGSRDEPAHLDFARVIDADRGEEHWLAASFGWPLPTGVREAGGFAARRKNPYPWWTYAAEVDESAPHATKLPIDDLTPLCRVTSAVSNDGLSTSARELHIAVRSRRGARGLMLRCAPGVAIRTVALHGRQRSVDHLSVLVIVGAEKEDVDVVLDVEKGAAAELEIMDSMRLSLAEGRALFDARPETWVPSGEGDVSIVVKGLVLDR